MMRSQDMRAAAFLFGRFSRPYRRALALLVLLSLAAAFLTAVQPLVLAPAIDVTLLTRTPPAGALGDLTLNNVGPTLIAGMGIDAGQRPFTVLLLVAGLFVLIAILAAGLQFATLQLMRWIRTSVANDIQSELYAHTLSLSMPFFVKNRVGELAHRFVFDVLSTAQSFDPVVKGILESSIQIAIYGFILLRTDSRLAATVGVIALLHIGITRLLQNHIRQASADSFDGYGRIGALAQETFTGIRIVKSFSAEPFEQARLQDVLRGLRRVVMRFGFYANSEAPLRQVADAIAIGAALLVSFGALSAGRLTVTGFGLFVLVARQTIAPFSQLSTALVQLQAMIGASRRLMEIFAARPTVVDGVREAAPLQSRLRLQDVTFEYEPGRPVLQGLSLDIPRGHVVALVGPSGAGKSTLADLVLRLHDPTSGAVTYDGIDVREFRQATYRRRFGVVSQEGLLFNATIEENIAYGRPADAAEVDRAARVAHADEFIRELPEGLRTRVSDRGIRLSGGQRQRIAIARAVYGRPEILVLDEATSSLDSESERQVQKAIDEVLQGATALVIAHRLSTVRKADTIVVLEAGRVEAMGTHAVLLETSPLYRRLHGAQFRDQAEEVAP